METQAEVQVVADLTPIESYMGFTESLRASTAAGGSTSMGSTAQVFSRVDGMVQSSVMFEDVIMFQCFNQSCAAAVYETDGILNLIVVCRHRV